MRSSKSRSRNKSNRQRSLGNVVNRVFDSSGPEGKVRGTPQQIIEKYLTLARDAQLSGDRVAEQSFFQHAEHYTRMLGEAQREMVERQGYQGGPRGEDEGGYGQSGGNGNGNGHRDHAPRDQGHREQGHREQGHREQSHREQGHREQGNRDQGHQGHRDQQTRDQNTRDQGGRDHTPREQADREAGLTEAPQQNAEGSQSRRRATEARPARRSRDDQPAERAPVQPGLDLSETAAEALPDAVSTGDAAEGPVPTPEAETPAKPARARSSRPRSTAAATPRTTRSRRKPAEGESPSEAPSENGAAPAAGEGGED